MLCDICGKEISSGKYISNFSNDSTYHEACFNNCQRCPICASPIEKNQEITRLSDNKVCHLACFKNADLCGICGDPICKGERYRTSEKHDETWHFSCFNKVDKCGITGRPITPGTEIVNIGGETFIKAEYDKCAKCLVSGLPISNHGNCLVNSRTKTYVLEKFQHQTRQCYSCGDYLIDGFETENDLFLCRYCHENGIRDNQTAQPHIKSVLSFFREEGLAVPDNLEIRILPPGRLIDENQPGLKGRCRTHCGSKNGEPSSLSYTIEILWGLNPDVFTSVAAHELSHAIIAEALFNRSACEKPAVPYEEGRCEYTAYTFAGRRNLPEYIIERFSRNQVDNYRKEFLHVKKHPPANIKALLTSLKF